MKNILLIATGGTIASVNTDHGLVPGTSGKEILSYVPEAESVCHIDVKQILNLDSTNLQPEHWLKIVHGIQEVYEQYDGFVITHGTDTMAYTAAALSYLIQNSPKPIVFTGAQKPMGSEITDAKTNLRDSIIYASDEESYGVQIVFDGKAIAGTRAKKTRTMSFSAFSSINYPYLAGIYDGRIIRYADNGIKGARPLFSSNINQKVYLMKLVPGITPDLIPSIFASYDGIIIESFGAGGIPENIEGQLFDELAKYDPLKKVVVMATQVQYEGSNIDVYQVGKKLSSKFNILEARDMTLEAAYTKLMWVLAQDNRSWDELRSLYYSSIGCDTLF